MYKKKLKAKLDVIYKKYHSPRFLRSDPLIIVHRFHEPLQIEIVGLLASCLAYGRVETIIFSIESILKRAGNDLLSFVLNTSYTEKKKNLYGFKHRFNTGIDIAILLETVKCILSEYGSIGNLINKFNSEETYAMKNVLSKFTHKINFYKDLIVKNHLRSFSYLIPYPERGSACKRMNMYFRWMIRRNDGIDFGIWQDIPPSILVIPVDIHVAKIARYLHLSKRKKADWKMAEEITESLRKVDPGDPIKYDFSLCRYGMEKFRSEQKSRD
ncbi:MAG: TIGR02757 family protein [Chitinispirillia bacterium]|jgi:uncharacterized protein (TIGR02757 family)